MATERRDKSGARILVPGHIEKQVKSRTQRLNEQEKRMNELERRLEEKLKE